MSTSAGTKVTPGDAPTYREGAGIVTNDSLAAESVNAGGEFASNRNIDSSSSTTTTNNNNPASQKPHETPAQVAAAANSSTQGAAAAPTYVNAQNIRDPSGPHGKNVTEDAEMTGRPAKFDVEIGSKEDPARQAEKSFAGRQVGGAPGGGNGDGEQPYEALVRETDA